MTIPAVPGRYTLQVTVTLYADSRSDAYQQVERVLSQRHYNDRFSAVTFVDAEDIQIEPYCNSPEHEDRSDDTDLAVKGLALCTVCLAREWALAGTPPAEPASTNAIDPHAQPQESRDRAKERP